MVIVLAECKDRRRSVGTSLTIRSELCHGICKRNTLKNLSKCIAIAITIQSYDIDILVVVIRHSPYKILDTDKKLSLINDDDLVLVKKQRFKIGQGLNLCAMLHP